MVALSTSNSRLMRQQLLQNGGGGGAAKAGNNVTSSSLPSSLPSSVSSSSVSTSLYAQLVWQQEWDEHYQKDLAQGRRIGFYKFKSELGSGNFSKVKLATHLLTQERVAVKIIEKSKLDSKTQKMVAREISIMDSASHPCLIQLYEVCETSSTLYLVMEHASGGELFNRLADIGHFSEDEAKGIFAQITSAIEYMHDHYLIHRDIKAENVFFSGKASNGDGLVKVGDFGFATRVNRIDQHLNTFCGSPPYAAPELFQDDHYLGPSVDVWALGILLYFMVSGAMPFKGATVAALKHAILEGKFEMPSQLTVECMELINGILRRKPAWRLTIEQIRDSRWLCGVPWPSPSSSSSTSLSPLKRHASKDMSKAEEKVRAEMAGLGITGDIIEDHVDRGVRSQVIGTFKILMHREQSGLSRLEARRLSESYARTHHYRRKNSSSLPVFPGKTKVENPEKSGSKKKSKMCNLL